VLAAISGVMNPVKLQLTEFIPAQKRVLLIHTISKMGVGIPIKYLAEGSM
jgi:hypothetical protein